MEEEPMSGGLNDLVPKDDLHWDCETNTYSILSKKDTSDVIEACVRLGMTKEKEIIKVLEEYERVKAGELLFKRFLSGGVGVYEFDEQDCPVFEPVRDGH
jgi:hypothetical protein